MNNHNDFIYKIIDIPRIHNAYSIPDQCLNISTIKNIHHGSDIYIIAGGPSLNYIETSFFLNKICISVNHAYKIIQNTKYIIAKEDLEDMSDFIKDKSDSFLITSEWKYGSPNLWKNEVKYPNKTILFTIDDNLDRIFEKDSDTLFGGPSTTLTAIHVAAYMGAKNIILAGHDCGSLDDNIHVNEYNTKTAQTPERQYAHWMSNKEIEKQTIDLKLKIKEKYLANVLSINPFINFNLEGHKYKPFEKTQTK